MKFKLLWACLLTPCVFADEPQPQWQISTAKDWQGFISKSKGVKVADGHAIAQKREVSFTSKVKKFANPAKLRDIELKQSVEWMNWKH